MKLSTKSRYGVRALFDLAYNSGSLPSQVQDISRRQDISPRYLEQIFQNLKKAGILTSKRGPKGGYCLAKKPEEISVKDILLATEGASLFVDCVVTTDGRKKRKSDCALNGCCITQTLWNDANTLVTEHFSKITLKDLCDRAHAMGLQREVDHRVMYFI
jgi:Rrf2 family transcriptional regulator, iron-sulfur cluster assembly transcription factor